SRQGQTPWRRSSIYISDAAVRGRTRTGARRHLADARAYGTNTPGTANTPLPAVDARPSGPPSITWTWFSSQIARLPVWTDPGSSAFAVVTAEQVEPIVFAVCAQVMVI